LWIHRNKGQKDKQEEKKINGLAMDSGTRRPPSLGKKGKKRSIRQQPKKKKKSNKKTTEMKGKKKKGVRFGFLGYFFFRPLGEKKAPRSTLAKDYQREGDEEKKKKVYLLTWTATGFFQRKRCCGDQRGGGESQKKKGKLDRRRPNGRPRRSVTAFFGGRRQGNRSSPEIERKVNVVVSF